MENWLAERANMTHLIRQHQSQAQDRIKKHVDKYRSEREFSVGTMVYLKLQPYVQSSVTAHANQKLSFKYFGPFKILERVGAVVYRLQLPENSAMHLVMHVSRLKLAAGFKGTVSDSFPSEPLQHCVPLHILQSRLVARGTDQVVQVLVHWSGLPASLATWENRDALYQRVPGAAA
jgi:hypothetical protein